MSCTWNLNPLLTLSVGDQCFPLLAFRPRHCCSCWYLFLISLCQNLEDVGIAIVRSQRKKKLFETNSSGWICFLILLPRVATNGRRLNWKGFAYVRSINSPHFTATKRRLTRGGWDSLDCGPNSFCINSGKMQHLLMSLQTEDGWLLSHVACLVSTDPFRPTFPFRSLQRPATDLVWTFAKKWRGFARIPFGVSFCTFGKLFLVHQRKVVFLGKQTILQSHGWKVSLVLAARKK